MQNGPFPTGRWAGYAACLCAWLFAAVSFYWSAGGRLGLDMVGREAVELSRWGNVAIFAAVWLVGLLKVAGGLLALALVQPWGRRLPRRALLTAGWGRAHCSSCTAVCRSPSRCSCGPERSERPWTWTGAIQRHLYLWNPWFVLWGVLLALAAFSYTRATRATLLTPGRRPARARGPHAGRRGARSRRSA